MGGSLSGAGTVACPVDYVYIPGGQATAVLAIAAAVPANVLNDRFCGRRFASGAAAGADAMICTRVRPFKMTVVTDDGEVSGATATNAVVMQATNEGSIDVLAAAGAALQAPL